MPERSTDWMQKVKRDISMARHASDSEYYEWTCFISQQAAEKAVKSLYQSLGASARGHSVFDLLKGLEKRLIIATEIEKDARRLDKYYVPARYPDGFESGIPGDYYDIEDAVAAISSAERILQFCNNILSR